jgi:hypothetical protein
VAWKRS